jgi:hypothetical protein
LRSSALGAAHLKIPLLTFQPQIECRVTSMFNYVVRLDPADFSATQAQPSLREDREGSALSYLR